VHRSSLPQPGYRGREDRLAAVDEGFALMAASVARLVRHSARSTQRRIHTHTHTHVPSDMRTLASARGLGQRRPPPLALPCPGVARCCGLLGARSALSRAGAHLSACFAVFLDRP
jgi:hypothetical protein